MKLKMIAANTTTIKIYANSFWKLPFTFIK